MAIPKHIAMVCSYFNPRIGGIEKHVYYLIRGLLSRGYRVTVITSNNDPYIHVRVPFRKTNSLEIVPLPVLTRPMNNPIQLGLIKKLLSDDFDIIHVHDHYYYGSFMAALIKHIIKKPMILTYHTSKLRFHNPIKNFIVDLYENTVAKYIFNQTDKIIVVVKSVIDDLIKLKVHPDKIVYIPNAINPDEFRIIDEQLYNFLKSEYEFIILFVGRLVERKGVNILLKGFQFALQQRLIPDKSILLIVGEGPLKYFLKMLSRKLGIENHVKFEGVVSQAVLNTLYTACNLVVVPSLSGETTSLVIQEAIINEKPFIASIIGGIIEYKERGIWGIYIKPGNYIAIAKGLAYIYKNKHKIVHELKENRRKLLEECSIERMVTRTIRIYNEVFSNIR